MKLYELKKGDKIKLEFEDGSKYCVFNGMDGAYAKVTTEKGGRSTFSSLSDIEKKGDEYIFFRIMEKNTYKTLSKDLKDGERIVYAYNGIGGKRNLRILLNISFPFTFHGNFCVNVKGRGYQNEFWEWIEELKHKDFL